MSTCFEPMETLKLFFVIFNPFIIPVNHFQNDFCTFYTLFLFFLFFFLLNQEDLHYHLFEQDIFLQNFYLIFI